MANEFKHKDPGTALTQAEFIASDGTGHIFDCQATGDIMYASSATVLKNLGKGAANTVLSMGGSCIPAWTASPSVTDLTIGGGCITLSAATDIDLLDNNASALSFDSTGKAGIIDIVTTDGSEGVTMSGTLGVTGLLTAGSLDVDDVLISGTTIGHTCDTDLLTLGNATLLAKGTVTVGVDGTGHDVKFFGCEAGAYMLYDESEEQLEIRGAAADAATSTGKLLLTTALTNINACDVIGSINFQAPAEAGGTDAVAIAAGIRAVAQATFTCAVNATDLIFYTGHSEAATEKFRFTSQNEIGVAGANYGTDGQVLTSGGAGAAVAWEDAGGADLGTANTWTADQTFNDDIKLTLGTGGDADISYNATNLVVNPQVAGTGHFVINEGTIGGNPANAGTLNLNSTDAAFSGPIMVVHHNTASPADNDEPFRIYVRGPSCGGGNPCHVTHAIHFKRCDVSDGSTDTSFQFDIANNSPGAANTAATLTNAGVWTDASAAKDKEFEGDATTVWGSRVIDKLSTLNVGRYHAVNLPTCKTPLHHVSPTAEDLWEMFGVGTNPYTLNRSSKCDGVLDLPTPGIAAKDLAGLGLMAVQELTLEINTIKSRLTAACIA